uniref:PTBP1-like RNA recognition motif 2 domain-containing protein n=1 Tax=Timema bartmani TaxID=61472 RepID=A0A7R9I2X8_9NEOP|nr:unnamed protein product [Timema bartmani]
MVWRLEKNSSTISWKQDMGTAWMKRGWQCSKRDGGRREKQRSVSLRLLDPANYSGGNELGRLNLEEAYPHLRGGRVGNRLGKITLCILDRDRTTISRHSLVYCESEALNNSATNANASAQAALQAASALSGQNDTQGGPNTVLRVIVEHMVYPVTLDVLCQRYSNGTIRYIVLNVTVYIHDDALTSIQSRHSLALTTIL